MSTMVSHKTGIIKVSMNGSVDLGKLAQSFRGEQPVLLAALV